MKVTYIWREEYPNETKETNNTSLRWVLECVGKKTIPIATLSKDLMALFPYAKDWRSPLCGGIGKSAAFMKNCYSWVLAYEKGTIQGIIGNGTDADKGKPITEVYILKGVYGKWRITQITLP